MNRNAIALLVASLLPLLAAVPVAAQEPALTVRIVETFPASGGMLGANEPFHVRLAYESSGPVRFWIEGFSAGKEVTDGASTSIHPLYPPGAGEALQWIAYHGPAKIDEIRVHAAVDDWTADATVSEAVDLEWSESAARSAPPAWAERLNREQQALGRQTVAEEPDLWLGGIVISLGWISVLGYLVLQPLTLWRWSGRWRLAALLPLVATVPLFAHALFALSAGSNLWPLGLIFFMPLAFAWLVIAAIVRWLAGRRGRT